MIKDFKQFILATSIGAKKAYSDFNRNYLRISRYWDTLSATQLYLYLYNIVDNSFETQQTIYCDPIHISRHFVNISTPFFISILFLFSFDVLD